MFLIFLMIVFLAAAITLPFFFKDKIIEERNPQYDHDDYQRMKKEGIEQYIKIVAPTQKYLRLGIRAAGSVIALVCFALTSVLWVGGHEVAHLDRIYMASTMPPGRIIAMPDEKGPQAEIISAGFHFIPFIRVLYNIEMQETVVVGEGKCAYLVARDGAPLSDDQFMADGWDNKDEMINALKFMGWTGDRDSYKGPLGVKGPQLTVLSPGEYRINRYLFDVDFMDATDIPIGNVGVIKSNVGKRYTGAPILPTGVESTTLSVPIVPKGYKGVWDTVLRPDRYYLNTKAYVVTIIPTQIQTWKYIGGYTRRYIDLELEDDGKIKQSIREEKIDPPKDAADYAILLRVENWDIFQDARLQVQVTPENAPFVVAAAGGLANIEDKIMTPTFRSVLRNEVAKEVEDTREVWDEAEKKMKTEIYMRPRKVMDLYFKREQTETAVEKKLIPEGAKYGLTVMEARFGDPVPPPELLLPGKRKQLAESLIATYKQEKIAQEERVKTESERARANQQGDLMRSEINIQVAKNDAKAREEAGVGEKKYLEAVAKGQEAQAVVLGKDKAFELALMKEILSAAKEKPEIIKYPDVLVTGNSGGFEGAAAILGKSNLNMGLMKTGQPASLPK
jgi:regulator of protease activity HflC (stomatin/prohibitin superfamily)